MNGSILNSVSEMRYLGVILDRKLCWNAHITNMFKKVSYTLNTLAILAKVNWVMGSKALKIIYDGAILPQLTYAAPAWFDGIRYYYNRRKLRSIQRLIVLLITKGLRTISYEASYVLAGLVPICIKIQECADIYLKVQPDTLSDTESNLAPRYWLHPGRVASTNNNLDSDDHLLIYTDGSKINNCTGCAFVAYYNDNIIAERSFKLHPNCSNNQAEAFAILPSLNWMNSRDDFSFNNIILFTDSQVNISKIQDRKCHDDTTENIRFMIWKLSTRNINITINWVKGHSGVIGNDKADEHAKAAAKSDLTISFSKLPKFFIKNDILR
nr:uncharacterized protein LOC107456125 [Parasteatoda tepidariorum]